MSKLGTPPPLSTQISKLPTDVVSGIRAITHGHGRSQERYLFGLPAAAGAVFFVACDTVRPGYLCPRCAGQTV